MQARRSQLYSSARAVQISGEISTLIAVHNDWKHLIMLKNEKGKLPEKPIPYPPLFEFQFKKKDAWNKLENCTTGQMQ